MEFKNDQQIDNVAEASNKEDLYKRLKEKMDLFILEAQQTSLYGMKNHEKAMDRLFRAKEILHFLAKNDYLPEITWQVYVGIIKNNLTDRIQIAKEAHVKKEKFVNDIINITMTHYYDADLSKKDKLTLSKELLKIFNKHENLDKLERWSDKDISNKLSGIICIIKNYIYPKRSCFIAKRLKLKNNTSSLNKLSEDICKYLAKDNCELSMAEIKTKKLR